MASILNTGSGATSTDSSANTTVSGVTPYLLSSPSMTFGQVQAVSTFTIQDASGGASSTTTGSANLSRTYNFANKANVTPPTDINSQAYQTYLLNLFCTKAGRKAFSAVDGTGVTMTYAAFTDALCNNTVLKKLHTIEINNQGPEASILINCAEVSTADIKLAPGGTFLFVTPLDGIPVTGTGITIKSATAGKTADVFVVTSYSDI
jgi:hypothetical protein